MFTVEKQVIINLPHATSWQNVKDISLAHNYIPNVAKIEIVTPQKEGVGASRKAYLEKGDKLVDETVISWKDGTGFTLELKVNGKRVFPWFNKFHFRYHIEPVDEKTLFKAGILYEPRCRFLSGLQHKIFSWALGKELKVICASMKAYYETGESTTKSELKEIRDNL